MRPHVRHPVTMLIAILAVSGSVTAQAQGAQKVSDARIVYSQVRQTLAQAMLWEKKSPAERRQAVVLATALRDRSDKSLGGSRCSMAAQAHLDLIVNMNSVAYAGQGGGGLSPFRVLGMMSEAEQLGEHVAVCHEEISRWSEGQR